jgi:hypothetical protein
MSSASATETPEMLHEALREHSLSQTIVFVWHSHFKGGQVSVADEHSGSPSTSMVENVEKFYNPSMKTITKQAQRHRWDQLPSFPGDLNRKFEYPLHCSITTMHPPHTSLKTAVCD